MEPRDGRFPPPWVVVVVEGWLTAMGGERDVRCEGGVWREEERREREKFDF